MQFEYRLTLQDYQEATQTHFKKMQRFSYIVCWVISLLCGVAGILLLVDSILFITGIASNAEPKESIRSLIYGCLFFALGIFLNPEVNLIQRYLIYQNWKSNPSLRQHVSVEVSEEGMNLQGENFQSFVKWQIYTKFLENKNIFLLYQSNNIFNPIPKRGFNSNEQIEQFRDLLARNILKKS